MKIEIHRVSWSLLALVALGGCASFNDCYYEKTQKARAYKEYVNCGKPQCSEYPHDYKKGWIDGFYEVATGGSECPPAVAPAKYYEPKEILKYRDKKRHDYYSGWQDGAARATQFPDTHYLRIYETSDCPFPRCDKPCSDGTCGPCREAFVGISAASEMIEAPPAAGVPQEYVEDESLRINEDAAPKADATIQLTIPQVNAVEKSAIESTTNAVSLPVPEPAPKPLLDIPTIPLLPPASIASSGDVPAIGERTVAEAATQAELTPLVSIPGYRATTQWSRPAAREMKAQPAGFIRLVEPARDPQTHTINGAEPIVIVEAPYQHYQISDTDTEAQPVVKLVE